MKIRSILSLDPNDSVLHRRSRWKGGQCKERDELAVCTQGGLEGGRRFTELGTLRSRAGEGANSLQANEERKDNQS